MYCFSFCRAICRWRTGSAIFSGGLIVVIKAWMTSMPCAAQVVCISRWKSSWKVARVSPVMNSLPEWVDPFNRV